MKRYLVATVPGAEMSSGVNIGMLLEGEEDAVLTRILRLVKSQPSACWSITTDSPFGKQR